MNTLKKIPITALGYDYIPPAYLPIGENEYYLRNHQNRSAITHRSLTSTELEALVRNRNTSDNWNNVLVADNFNADLVRNCTFFGLVRIGNLEPLYLEFHSIRFRVGLYNSTIISCDLGHNVVIENVNYLSHYIIGSEVVIVNVNEMVNTNYSKFGNGILKDGEEELGRIWLELCNENGGRSVLPFSGMLPGDAYLWTRYRDDNALQQKFKEFTEQQLKTTRGYYGKVGDRTVIKNCKMIKDAWIGSDAYLKGANKIKNITINSDAERKSQIGEGCELVNGIMGYGCKVFYGAKAVRFVMGSQSQLKYGARLINSYLGDNATISCCEVLNSLIFPSHEQHHNNSFLCAALIMGQSNLAAGATIGSNHNSRAADGEMIANRGFWPGLCVSLKHNSYFASFSIIAKGDYNYELNIKLPFSLISQSDTGNELTIMPAYWFMYNMYALARNAAKYAERDKRIKKIQLLEFDYLAPDTANEIHQALILLETYTGNAFFKNNNTPNVSEAQCNKQGKKLLINNDPIINSLKVYATNTENSNRNVLILKVQDAYNAYLEQLTLYLHNTIIITAMHNNYSTLASLKKLLIKKTPPSEWENIGGQLIPKTQIDSLIISIKNGKTKSWIDIRSFYKQQGDDYASQKLIHAISYLPYIGITTIDANYITTAIDTIIKLETKKLKNITISRAKDYENPFKTMAYRNTTEQDAVIGKLSDNLFIKQQTKWLANYKKSLLHYKKNWEN